MWLVARDGRLKGAVPLCSYHWAFDGWRIYCDGSSTFSVCLFGELLGDGREGRMPIAWHFPVRKRKNYCIEEKRTPSLRGEVLGADTTGPAVASRYTSFIIYHSSFILHCRLFFVRPFLFIPYTSFHPPSCVLLPCTLRYVIFHFPQAS